MTVQTVPNVGTSKHNEWLPTLMDNLIAGSMWQFCVHVEMVVRRHVQTDTGTVMGRSIVPNMILSNTRSQL